MIPGDRNRCAHFLGCSPSFRLADLQAVIAADVNNFGVLILDHLISFTYSFNTRRARSRSCSSTVDHHSMAHCKPTRTTSLVEHSRC